MRHVKSWLKPICFLLGLAIIISGIQGVFGVTDYRIYHAVQGFYAEPENSLDAVYIGASNTYAYWQAPVAWEEYGYAVYPWSVPSMPAEATKYIVEDARKTQPDALYIINLNDFKTISSTESKIHYVVDYMPMSTTKVKLIRDLAGQCGITGLDQLEFYLPLIRFHSGWSELTSTAFDHPLNQLKAAVSYKTFLSTGTDVTASYRETEQTVALTPEQDRVLEDLLSYCEDNSVRVLFVIVPQALTDETLLAQLNMIASIAESRGFDVLNMERAAGEIGLDMTTDYYNTIHTNVHGSLKYTSYLGSYLSEHYDFEDKRGDPAYASWDAAYEMYREILSPYALDFEISHADRDDSLAAPTLSKLTATGQSFTLTWKKTAGADGYWIYRKRMDHNSGELFSWECIANVDAKTTSYIDEKLVLYDKYWYTVVPVKTQNGGVSYGKFDITGLSGTTIMNAPELLSLEETEDGVTITWKALKGAEGYSVYRKINGQSWVRIDTVDSGLSYTDRYYQEGLPYLYTVRAYQTVDDAVKYSYYDTTGLLLMRDLAAPEVALEVSGKSGATLTWDAVKGANSYSVYRKTGKEDWQLLKGSLTVAEYTDATVEEGVTYSYRVASVLKYGGETYEYPSDTVSGKVGDSEK